MAVGDPGLDTLVAWAQYWSILATLAVVEVAVTRQVNRYLHIYISTYLHIYCVQFDGLCMRAAKVVVLLWLVAPGPYSGSRLLFSHLLAPLHTKVTSSAPLLASKVVSYLDTVSCLLCVLRDLLRPLADTSTAVRVIVI